MRSHHKLKNIKSPYHNAYRHQSCQGGDIPIGASTHKVTGSSNLVVFWDHVTNTLYLHLLKTYGHQTRQCGEIPWKSPSLKSRDSPLIPWPKWCHAENREIYFFTFARLMATKLGRVLSSGGNSKGKRQSCHRLFVAFLLTMCVPGKLQSRHCWKSTIKTLQASVLNVFKVNKRDKRVTHKHSVFITNFEQITLEQ